MRSFLAICLVLGLCVSARAGESAEVIGTRAAEWADEAGAATAKRIIDRCLANPPARPLPEAERKAGCVRAAIDPCLAHNGGNSSQLDLNFCFGYSRKAWRGLYGEVIARFEALFARRRGAQHYEWIEAPAAQFAAQEQAWERWMLADCELRTVLSVGGSIHGMQVTACQMRHVAYRTLDLSETIDWWETR